MTDTRGLVPALRALITESPQLSHGDENSSADVAALLAPLLVQAADGSAPDVSAADIYAAMNELIGILDGSKMVRPVATPPGVNPQFPEIVLPFTRYPMMLFAFIVNAAIAIRGSVGETAADDFVTQVVFKHPATAVTAYVSTIVTVT